MICTTSYIDTRNVPVVHTVLNLRKILTSHLTSITDIFIVICTVLILIFNIGVPNELKGFLFFAQVFDRTLFK